MHSEENKRIRREITYLSGLNNRYIVRYFQTWVERETDPDIIKEFENEEDDEYYDEEEESEAESSSLDWPNKKKQNVGRSSSLGKKGSNNSKGNIPPFKKLQAESDSSSDDSIPAKRKRAGTDNFKKVEKKVG